MKREMSDRLIKAVDDYKATRSEEAFNIIYEETKKYLYVCIYNRVKGNDNALELTEDILVETMLTISEKINQNKETKAFLVWASKIVRSQCSDYFDKASTRHEVLRTAEEETARELAVADEAFIPENMIDTKEKVRLIKEIINQELNDNEYKCVYYYYYEDMKQHEIADFLDMNENSVKTNLSRAKAKIKTAVLRMEKEKGTKLYSFAPFMLLLFRQEIADAVVPEAWKQVVMQKCAVNMSAYAGAQATQGTASSAKNMKASSIGKKIASAPLKTKVIGGLAGLGVVGAIGGAALSHKSVIPEDAGYFKGHYYYVQEMQDTSWEQAEEYFESIGGHLLTISSQEENDYAFQYMNESGYTSAYFGLSDAETEGDWKWVTGEKVKYTNWNPGEPNSESDSEDYVMFYYKFKDGKWNDGGVTTVGNTNIYICEWDKK